MPLPPLRNLDIVPVEQDGETLVCLRDPEGYVEEALVLSPAAFLVAACLDGSSGVADIQQVFARRFGGRLLLTEDVMAVVGKLDEAGFLLSERFLALQARVHSEFARSPVRKAYLAGKSYPAEPGELRAFLDALFTRPGGPGPLDALRSAPGGSPSTPAKAALRALVAPHLDFDRGAAAYAQAYGRLAQWARPGLALVFGVAHAAAPAPFILTHKHFETPFGTIKTDRAAVDRLARACTWDPFEYEAVHRTEHSIEFQAVMLGYLYGTAVRIVPILCGPFLEDPAGADAGATPEAVNRFLNACRDVAASRKRNVTVVAGADLAHVGRRFGDPFDITERIARQVRRRDEQDLARVQAVDPDGFSRSVMRDRNARRVCGHACIYAALKTIDGAARHGELLHYGHAPDPAGGIVSHAAIVFEPETSPGPGSAR